jgi:hypothetical protein
VVAAALSTAGQQLLQMRPDLDQTCARISISTRQAVARQVAAWQGDRSMSQVGNKGAPQGAGWSSQATDVKEEMALTCRAL